ncbi:hypothetical protein [Calothrix sp. NIES-3974]|nr:hypothetical protein [Calothrix sp. NIES-3974]
MELIASTISLRSHSSFPESSSLVVDRINFQVCSSSSNPLLQR